MSGNELEGRVALVTGGARGIGEAIARILAGAGASVVIADSGTGIDGIGADPSIAQACARSIGKSGGGAAAFTESIASPSAAAAAVDFAATTFGGLDILVNNAAILRDALVFKGDPGDWDAVIHNNLSAAYYLTHAASQVMREQFKSGRGPGEAYDWGRIVNVISTAGLYGNYGQASYGAAKAGLFALSRITALEMARSNVTCNAVAPFAHTRVTDIIQPANDEQAVYKERAIKVSPDHVARFVAFLCAAEAGNLSGQLFGVRGREVFLFSQPRPAVRIVSETTDWTTGTLAGAVAEAFTGGLTELATDLEAFNTEPIV
ncbi:MAG TPA: SDR family NAD(P)-dependent oxidoreductase [Alphaproteobacteria bacterium]|nr:SDR family NAD(P)-dependent oxidoreductase [Alphaproteobacteria bacterium]